MNTLVFDIETVADIEQGKKYLNIEQLDDRDALEAILHHARSTSGTEFVRLPWQKVVAISVCYHSERDFKIWSLGNSQSSEQELIERFYKGIEKYTPTLVSWNGSGFDLPVLHYRALKHGISAPLYWESGQKNSDFKWNNYISRYHSRHCDLMDVMAGYQPRAFAKLDEIATLCGFPGKMGMSGNLVQQYFDDGKIDEIRAYCETDVLNTFLVYCRFELMRGSITQAQYDTRMKIVQKYIAEQEGAHWQEFGQNWQTR